MTGAGISAESGIPTFRKNGRPVPWGGYDDPTTLSHVDSLSEDIEAVWRWFSYRIGLIGECKPNAGHLALAAMATRFERLNLVTQNVDGLHQRAGSSGVVELHGNIWRARCLGECGAPEVLLEMPVAPIPPQCSCGSPLRPGVVMYGEVLEDGPVAAAHAATKCDLFLVIGTSGVVWPAALLPVESKRHGAFVVEINPEETPLTEEVDLSIRALAGELLPALLAQLGGSCGP